MVSANVVLKAEKRTMRKALSSTLKTISPAIIEKQSKAVADRVLLLDAFRKSKTISCYLSMPTMELDTSMLVQEIVRSNKTLFVPKISSDDSMDFLEIHGADDIKSLPSSLWGIREPGPTWNGFPRRNALDAACDDLDVILVPGVAFDRTLSRLGHGKGYYDRYISEYEASGRPRPLLVALALQEQVLDSILPIDDHDQKMDMIVTPAEIIY
ncbi:5-formyltetrahydrofolate cyclo-ligase [Guyanagaster necrorhizus]|uniref:5-formyltetrahydrofolate cyclo-ligase n=1 Tax=Guyanagaster necrorhizus TaxID=856835 RepID=A0A9P7VX09_9AGAR|nr:5-formyltetrahydrofolate cyclo-ligase [Guyanagaster necrorhizus MCA 3950]KAG7448472.1 5-formyltetrahydrofolate cyclo-ligase [Guyanagaster necrorhizus MCA 3950]